MCPSIQTITTAIINEVVRPLEPYSRFLDQLMKCNQGSTMADIRRHPSGPGVMTRDVLDEINLDIVAEMMSE